MDSLTAVIAIYGALLSSAIFGWTLYRDFKDVGRLRLECGFHSIVTPGVGSEDNVLTYRITNIGSKPVVITNAGGRLSKGTGFIVLDNSIPKVLAPGQFLHVLGKEYENMWDGVTELAVYDSLGRTYRATKKDLRAVNAHLGTLKAAGITKSAFQQFGRSE